MHPPSIVIGLFIITGVEKSYVPAAILIMAFEALAEYAAWGVLFWHSAR
jgi:hypothetical protein